METGLKVLMISSDRNIFEQGSAVSARMKEYGTLVGELHIVVSALKSLGLKEQQIAQNVWVYPTNSMSRWFYISDAVNIGKKIVFNQKFVRGGSLITVQDPFECGLSGLRVKRRWRLPLEVQLHTNPFSPYFSGFLNTLRKMIARKVLSNANSVRIVTENLRKNVAKFTKANIRVLPIYVDKKKIEDSQIVFDLHARFGWRFILLTVSRLEPEKNLGLALLALRLVHERFQDVGLVIVGSGSEEGNLKKMAKKLGLESKVAFVGWQSDLASFYKTANIFLQTSFFEGYGLSLIEAGLSGLPAITTPVGIASELEHEKDAYIYSLDGTSGKPTELFAQGILDLIEYNHKRENLRVNMKQTLETKLISKEKFLGAIKEGWQSTASQKVQ